MFIHVISVNEKSYVPKYETIQCITPDSDKISILHGMTEEDETEAPLPITPIPQEELFDLFLYRRAFVGHMAVSGSS